MPERFGSWELDSLVAVGGLGEVWRAQRESETVALKRLHTHLLRNAEAMQQFATEQRLATTLPPHPNVVHAREAGEVDSRPYIALDLVSGADLRRIVAPPSDGAHVQLPRARVVAIVAAVCDAAAHVHASGYVHGDLCPGNIIVDESGGTDRVVVVDLGIARPIGEAGTVRGTHAYMAPEQVRGEAWTEATDVFALGVVLWELAAGKRLFHRGPPWLSMAAVVEEPVPALPDRALDAIAQAALAKEPAQRLSSASELALRLRDESR